MSKNNNGLVTSINSLRNEYAKLQSKSEKVKTFLIQMKRLIQYNNSIDGFYSYILLLLSYLESVIALNTSLIKIDSKKSSKIFKNIILVYRIIQKHQDLVNSPNETVQINYLKEKFQEQYNNDPNVLEKFQCNTVSKLNDNLKIIDVINSQINDYKDLWNVTSPEYHEVYTIQTEKLKESITIENFLKSIKDLLINVQIIQRKDENHPDLYQQILSFNNVYHLQNETYSMNLINLLSKIFGFKLTDDYFGAIERQLKMHVDNVDQFLYHIESYSTDIVNDIITDKNDFKILENNWDITNDFKDIIKSIKKDMDCGEDKKVNIWVIFRTIVTCLQIEKQLRDELIEIHKCLKDKNTLIENHIRMKDIMENISKYKVDLVSKMSMCNVQEIELQELQMINIQLGLNQHEIELDFKDRIQEQITTKHFIEEKDNQKEKFNISTFNDGYNQSFIQQSEIIRKSIVDNLK